MGMNAYAYLGYGIDLGEADEDLWRIAPKFYEALTGESDEYGIDWEEFLVKFETDETAIKLELQEYCCGEVPQYALLIKNSIIKTDWEEGTTFNHLPIVFTKQKVEFIQFCTKWEIPNKNPSWLLLARYW